MKREVIANKGIWVAKRVYVECARRGVRLADPKLKLMH